MQLEFCKHETLEHHLDATRPINYQISIFIKIVLKVHMKLSFSENNDLLNGMGFTDIY